MIEIGISDLLKRQLVGNLPVSLNFAQSNDVLVNLVTSISFLRKVCPKSCFIFQVLPLFIPWLQYKKLMCPLECLFIFHSGFLYIFCCTKMRRWMPWINRKKEQVRGRQSWKDKEKKKRERKENYRELERKFLQQLV